MSAVPFQSLTNFPDSVMLYVQSGSLALSSSFDRATAPYYVFGDLAYDNVPQTPPPCVRWRASDGHYDFTHSKGSFGKQGTVGTWMQTYDVRVYGGSYDLAFWELMLLTTAVRDQYHPMPPIGELSARQVSQGDIALNKKVGFEFQVVVPVQIPTNMQGVVNAILLTLTSSLSFSGSAQSERVTAP